MTAMSLHSMPMSKTTDTPFTDHPSTTTDYLRDHPGGSTIALTDEERGSGVRGAGTASERERARRISRRIDGYDGGVQITKRWAKSLERFTADPPTELPLRNSLHVPVTPESMSRLGVRYALLDNGRDPDVFIPGWVGPLADDGNISVWENPTWIGDAVAWPTVTVAAADDAADLLRTDPERYEGIAIVDQLDGTPGRAPIRPRPDCAPSRARGRPPEPGAPRRPRRPGDRQRGERRPSGACPDGASRSTAWRPTRWSSTGCSSASRSRPAIT